MMDLMNLLKQDEKLGRFTSSLYICHIKAVTRASKRNLFLAELNPFGAHKTCKIILK